MGKHTLNSLHKTINRNSLKKYAQAKQPIVIGYSDAIAIEQAKIKRLARQERNIKHSKIKAEDGVQ